MRIVILRTIVVLVAASTLTASTANGQDRVLLFDSGYDFGDDRVRTGQIQEFEVSQGGRVWSLMRTVPLPGHRSASPVLLADGSRVVWLAETGGFKILVQYELATNRASVIDIGQFDQNAFLLAEPTATRVAIVEPARVTFLDARLTPYSVVLPGPKRNLFGAAAAADGYIVLLRKTNAWDATDAEIVVINTQSAEMVRTLGLPRSYSARLAITRDAQRLYYSYYSADTFTYAIEMRSLANGDLLARADSRGYNEVFELDERAAALITSESPGFVARDPRTLARTGALPVSSPHWGYRTGFKVKRTPRDGTVLIFTYGYCSYCTGCWSPRIDVFDGRTFAPTNQINLRACAAILPLPPR